MGLRINNNIQSVNGHRNLQRNDAMAGRSMEKLSSGLRINRAADDAAGLIISEQMRAQIAGLGQAISNSETAVNMVQTAEGALDEMNTLMKKARTLALHAANEGANDQSQLVADQSELDNIIGSVTRIAEQTQFGGKKILDGSVSAFRSNSAIVTSAAYGNYYSAGLKDGSVVKGYHTISISAMATKGNLHISGGDATIISGSAANTIDGMSGSDKFIATFSVSVAGRTVTVVSGQTKNDFLNLLNAVGSEVGFSAVVVTGAASQVYSGIQTGNNSGVNTGNIALIGDSYGAAYEISYSFVGGASGATTLATTWSAGTDMTANLHLNTGGVGQVASTGNTAITLAQTGKTLTLVSTTAGQGFRIELAANLGTTGSWAGSTGGTFVGVIDGMSAGANFQVGANVGQTVSVDLASMRANDIGIGASSRYRSLAELGGSLVGGGAQDALTVIDKAIADVTNQRGKLGAFQSNTLESGLNSLRVSKENLTGAESTIRDVDFAEESASFTKYQILVQASTAMLAQANQLPQNVLKLLG